MKRRMVRPKELLAISADALHSGPKGIWWDLGTRVPSNERCGDVAVVHIRGSLEHHEDYGTDSYDAIIKRAQCAFDGETDGDDDADDNAGPPKAVVLRIDSPGGVVSGLNETVAALRRMSEESGIPLIGYVDELAASAAYAISCACSELFLPASAIAGSIGVISCMFDQVEADAAMGLNFVTLTSGARKADGHPHVAISDAAVNAEQRRVDRLAKQFFGIVSQARGLPLKTIESYQAGIFLGKEAVAKGLADQVMGWDELLSYLDEEKELDNRSGSGSSTNKRNSGMSDASPKRPDMLVQLRQQVKKAEAALAAETDPKKRKAIALRLSAYESALEAYKKEKHTIEKHETEEGEEEDEEESEEEESESEEEEESEAKGNETDRKEGGDDDSDEDDGDSDEDDDDAKKSRKSSLESLVYAATGKRGAAAVGALAAVLEQSKRTAATVDQIERERRAEKKSTLIDNAANARRITRHEAKTLRGKSLKFVKAFLDMRPKAIINVDDDTIHIPSPGADAESPLPAEAKRSVEFALAAAPPGTDKKKLEADLTAEHRKRLAAQRNGIGHY